MNDSSGIPFFGRRGVLAALTGHLDAVVQGGGGRIVAVRGRRQVGKSTVVERFVERAERPYVFATGVFGAATPQHLDDATRAVTESRHPLPDADLLTASTPTSWREWLGRVALAARSGPVIVILDEFPWMAAADRSLEGELQAQWDRVLERLPVLLVLVGSDVAMMERLAEHGRPLFGRLRPLVVSPLDPAEVADALPGRSAFEVFDAYLVTGGYPRLVADVAATGAETATDYVREALTDPFSPLVTTARFSLDAEFPEPQVASQVLSAIGSDDAARPGFNDVLSVISEPAERKRMETAVSRALRTLTEVKGLVEREQPAWSASASKLRRYRVTDPYLRFWFRYVERQADHIARGRSDLAVGAFDRDWSSWRGRSVEPVVRAAVERMARTDDRLEQVEAVRPWWVRDGSIEVDVVAQTPERTALVGTIKWRAAGGVDAHEVDQLRRHRERVPRSEDALLAAISPVGTAPSGVDVALGAPDLLQAWR
ncbi:ATP-binding protein [Isoptericola hypogeus]|uniref:ATP-binding protein n=1 Tax=Isoptericola hypogeus TaxID=300179 RepID=A0ABN2J8A7_9MICO